MFCPVCKVEYRSGFSRCADCDAELVEALPTEPSEKNYFGWGCRPADHCLDQLVITLPFYSSLAYSMGVALARKTLGFASSQSEAHLRALWVFGLIVLGAVVIDLAISTKVSGWQPGYLLAAATPTGVGVLLLYAGSTLHRQPVSNT